MSTDETEITVTLSESDRQATLLALSVLALHRPGWDYMLGEIAVILHGKNLFGRFKELNNDHIKPDGWR